MHANAPGLHVACPQCGTMSFATAERGFGLGNAAAGALLIGPVGLLGGMIGRKEIELACNACGHRWELDQQAVTTLASGNTQSC